MLAGVLRDVCCCKKFQRLTVTFALMAGTCLTAFAQSNSEVIGSAFEIDTSVLISLLRLPANRSKSFET